VTGGADELREARRRVAKPAADVENAVALMGRVGRERRLAVIAQPLGDEVAVLDPDLEQGAVPGLGRLDVVLDLSDRVRYERRVYGRLISLQFRPRARTRRWRP
jgi:hypothetical protein